LDYLSFLSILSSIIPLILGIYWVNILPKALKVLSAFIFIILILELLCVYLSSLRINNLFLFHANSFLEFVFYPLILSFILKNKIFQYTIIISITSFLIFAIFNIYLWEPLTAFNTNTRAVEGILMIAFCIYFYFDLFLKTEVVKLSTYPYFWLVSGLLIYFSGTLFLYLYANQIVKSTNITYWIIHSILNIFLNIMFSISIWLGSKKWT